jgi:hypothetical protein
MSQFGNICQRGQRLLWVHDKAAKKTAPRAPTLLEQTMKLSIITAAIIAYAILTTAWICYTELLIR